MLDKILVKEIVAPILIIIISFLLNLICKKLLKRFFKIKKSISNKQKTIYSLVYNVVKYFILIVAFLMILDIFGVDTKSLIASLGVLGLVVGLAFQDLLKDFISGMTIIFENQYCIGDIISVGDFKGEVIGLGLKTTRIRSYTGEVKILSNRNISEVINYSQMSSFALVDVSVAYEEDYEKVEKLLNNLFIDIKKNKRIPFLKSDIKVLGINELADSAVIIRIMAETESYKQYDVQRLIMKEIKTLFDKENIKIPYPQIEVHNGKGI